MKLARCIEIFCALLIICTICGCASDGAINSSDVSSDGKIKIVTTIYPPADFAEKVGGEYVSVSRLLKPGAESHTFEPSPKDILKINDCDLFIYVGGESDAWIDDILSSADTKNIRTIKMIDVTDILSEEIVEGMEPEEEEESDGEEELDEHVWTSLKNAALITAKICDELSTIDPEHKNQYEQNSEAYIDKLLELDNEYHEVVDNAVRDEIIVADRFPFRYMAHEYGLKYYAAFPGCSADSEPSAKTLSFLIEKAEEDRIPVIFHIEFSSEKIADSIVEVVPAKKSLLHSCHNLSSDEIAAGEDYLSIMRQNLINLKEALN